MKTAEEWAAIFADTDLAKTYFDLTAADIRAVQADAWRHVAAVCLRAKQDAVKLSAVDARFALQTIAEKLTAEADQLEGK